MSQYERRLLNIPEFVDGLEASAELADGMGELTIRLTPELLRELVEAVREREKLRKLSYAHRKAIKTHQKQIRRLCDELGVGSRREFLAVTNRPKAGSEP